MPDTSPATYNVIVAFMEQIKPGAYSGTDPRVWYQTGSSRVEIQAIPGCESAPALIAIWGHVVTGTDLAKVAVELLRLNYDDQAVGAFAWDKDQNRLLYGLYLVANGLTLGQFRLALEYVEMYSDHFDDELQKKSGGVRDIDRRC